MDLYHAKQITREKRVEKLRGSVRVDDANIVIGALPSSSFRVVAREAGFLLEYYNENDESPLDK